MWGDLSESELNDLYNDKKVSAMLMFTKGEGYGRPLTELLNKQENQSLFLNGVDIQISYLKVTQFI